MNALRGYSSLVYCFFLISALFAQGYAAADLRAKPSIIAILGIPEETEVLASQLKNRREIKVEGVSFTVGSLNGRSVVLARVGFGKVNAALAATLLIQHFKPEGLLFTG